MDPMSTSLLNDQGGSKIMAKTIETTNKQTCYSVAPSPIQYGGGGTTNNLSHTIFTIIVVLR